MPVSYCIANYQYNCIVWNRILQYNLSWFDFGGYLNLISNSVYARNGLHLSDRTVSVFLNAWMQMHDS